MDPAFRFHPYGDGALLACAAEEISEENYRLVRGLVGALEADRVDAVVELVPSYRSLLVVYDPTRTDYASIEAAVRSRAARAAAPEAAAEETVTIPVCYEPEYGPDLDEVAQRVALSREEVVALHSGAAYRVYMLGFTPGFPYLGGMSERIAAPRRATPRTRVPAGSVGIADKQTGVYPQESPGGWNIVGRTPALLFDPGRAEPTLLRAGQFVRFAPISADEYEAIAVAQREGRWRPAVERAAAGGGAP